VQQGDALDGGAHLQASAGHEGAEHRAVAGDLRLGVGALEQPTSMTERAETTIGRSDRVWAQIGAITSASRCGSMIGPPHESA